MQKIVKKFLIKQGYYKGDKNANLKMSKIKFNFEKVKNYNLIEKKILYAMPSGKCLGFYFEKAKLHLD